MTTGKKSGRSNSVARVKISSTAKNKNAPAQLRGWQAIAEFLSQPVAVAERWAKESGMPVSRQGRYVVASPDELNHWLGSESGEPVQIATESTDLAAGLQRGLSYIRAQRKLPPAKLNARAKK